MAESSVFRANIDGLMDIVSKSFSEKEIFLKELISNASDALDKIKAISVLDEEVSLDEQKLNIKIKADKGNRIIHVSDSGVGMTKHDLMNYLSTIGKSGNQEFLSSIHSSKEIQLLGKFGIGFYSCFLVADKVTVITKHQSDKQYIWESESNNISIIEDPRGDTFVRGTNVSLLLKEEFEYLLREDILEDLAKRYSRVIEYDVYLWKSKTDLVMEETRSEFKPVILEKEERTVNYWDLVFDSVPIWTRNPDEIETAEYEKFYKALTGELEDPFALTHCWSNVDNSFRLVFFVPYRSMRASRQGLNHIQLYNRRTLTTVDIRLLPSYLSFIRGVVDTQNSPRNVYRDKFYHHERYEKLKSQLIEAIFDMFEKFSKEHYEIFWNMYGDNIKQGIVDDPRNQLRLLKLLRFHSTRDHRGNTSLLEYVERMKENQEFIYYVTNHSKINATSFYIRSNKRSYEVLVETENHSYLSCLREFEGKRFLELIG